MHAIRLFIHCLLRIFSLRHQWWTYEERERGRVVSRVFFCRCGYQSPFTNTDELIREAEA